MKINNSRNAGFTLVEIMIVVAIIGLLAAIAIPNFVKARNTSQANACINNMRQVDSGIQQWALENGKSDSAKAVSTDVAGYVKGGYPKCPAKGTYTIAATVATIPAVACSLSGAPTPHKLP